MSYRAACSARRSRTMKLETKYALGFLPRPPPVTHSELAAILRHIWSDDAVTNALACITAAPWARIAASRGWISRAEYEKAPTVRYQEPFWGWTGKPREPDELSWDYVWDLESKYPLPWERRT